MFKLVLIIVIYSGSYQVPTMSQEEHLFMREDLCNAAKDYYSSDAFKDSISLKNTIVKVNVQCMSEDKVEPRKKTKFNKADGEM